MSEAQPTVFDLVIERAATDPATNFKVINMNVTVHSHAHSKRLQFLVDHNYSFDAADKFPEMEIEQSKDK